MTVTKTLRNQVVAKCSRGFGVPRNPHAVKGAAVTDNFPDGGRRVLMVRDFGHFRLEHVFIDLDSWCHSEVRLHVFRQQLVEDVNRLIVVEEGGFARDQTPRLYTMTREEFIAKYEIDVPELFSAE